MLSALVLAADASTPQATPDAVVRTLAALVPAAVEGLLRDVTLAGLTGGDLAEIADHAGGEVSESATSDLIIADGLKCVRGPALFVIRAGHAPEAGFIEEAGDFLARSGAAQRGALIRERPETFLSRSFPSLAPAAGLITWRPSLSDSSLRDFASLVRAAKPQVTLRVRARRVD